MAIFDDSDYIRKAYSELYLYCDPLKKPKWKVQNAGNIKKKKVIPSVPKIWCQSATKISGKHKKENTKSIISQRIGL